MGRVFIGTSGFSYKHWRGEFYPQDLPQSKWFKFYCQHFDTVELNVSFYRLPKKETFEKWRRIASISGQGRAHLRGEGKRSATAHLGGERRYRPFIFAIKGNRYITHVKKLKDCQEAVGKFFEAVGGLNSPPRRTHGFTDVQPVTVRGVILWQLPPRFRVNLGRLREFLGLLPKNWRHAFEFRSSTWLTVKVYNLLKKYNAAIVFQDYPDWPITEEITTDFVYLRFHGRQTLYSSCYTEEELKKWAKKIQGWTKRGLDVYTYFNNDALGHAVENAKTLKKFLISNV